ncbi:MAG TPA: hypothetical protein VEL76_12760 [Gemmataceae bacterium]|nr:hypothetical protein [Gemmataceae bacterium]
MRALCGAIIAAGAAIGLGLTALGVGSRYHNQPIDKTGEAVLHLYQMDRPLIFILVFLTCVAVIGLGIAFFGLAYHHHRRHHEMLREQERTAGQQRTTV